MRRLRIWEFSYSIKLRAVLAVSAVSAIFLGGLLVQNYRVDSREYRAQMIERTQIQANLMSDLLAQVTWDMNTTAIHHVISEALSTPDLEKIILRDPEGKIVESVWRPEWTGRHSVVTSPIEYTLGDEVNNLGQIELYVSHSRIDGLVKERLQFWGVLVLLAVLTQLIIFSLILGRILLPLKQITKTMLKLSQGETGLEIPSQHREDEIGQMARAIQTFRDTAVRADQLTREIEVRRLLHTEIENARRLAEENNQAKSQFLATMSHEIRTPMNGVLATAELLAETEMTDRQRRYLGIIRNSGEVLLSLLNDILDLSKIEAGKIEISPVAVKLRDAYEKTCEMFVAQAGVKGLEYSFSIDKTVPEYAKVDIFRLRQVMANLISNAVKYTATGSVTVRLDCEGAAASDGSRTIRFSVWDTGRGIPQESQKAIFEKFTQIHRTDASGGTGLGLPICKSLIEMMGGRISVESQQGVGSLFSFSVLIGPADHTETEDNSGLLSGVCKGGNCSILLVEDVEVNRFVIREMLEKLGCKVDEAVNGQEAVSCVENNHYTAIFMDCSMPVMDGYTATRILRDKGYTDVPIIAITAHALSEERQKCLNAGMSDFLTKPVSRIGIARMLDKWCRDVEAVDVNPAQAEQPQTEQPQAEQPAVPEQVITPADGAKKDPADTETPEFDASCLSAWYKPGREDRALRMIELTLKDFSRIHDEIVTAAEARDGAALADGAHALKSVAAQAGALALSVLCRRLELCAREQGYSPQVMESYSHFGPAYEKAINCILAFRGSLGKSGE